MAKVVEEIGIRGMLTKFLMNTRVHVGKRTLPLKSSTRMERRPSAEYPNRSNVDKVG